MLCFLFSLSLSLFLDYLSYFLFIFFVISNPSYLHILSHLISSSRYLILLQFICLHFISLPKLFSFLSITLFFSVACTLIVLSFSFSFSFTFCFPCKRSVRWNETFGMRKFSIWRVAIEKKGKLNPIYFTTPEIKIISRHTIPFHLEEQSERENETERECVCENETERERERERCFHSLLHPTSHSYSQEHLGIVDEYFWLP